MSVEEKLDDKAETLESEDWGDPTGKGLSAGLDEFFEKQDAERNKPAAEKVVSTPEIKETPESKTPEEKPEVTETESVMDEKVFSGEKEEKPVEPEGFNEEEFEKQTEEQSKGMEVNAGEKFKALRNELKEFKKQKLEAVIPEDTAKELAELKLKVQEGEGLKSRFEEVTSKSAKLMVESSQEYEDTIITPISNIFTKADEIAATYEVDPAHVRAIIKEGSEAKRDAMVEEFLDKVPSYNQARILNFSDEFSSILNKREVMMDNADEKINVSQAQSIEKERKALEEQRQSIQTITKEKFEKYKDVIPGLVDDDGKETDSYKKLFAEGMSIDFGQARGEDQAWAKYSSVMLPHAAKQIKLLQERLAVFESDDVKKIKTSPSASSSVKQTSSDPEKPAGFMTGFLDAELV